MHNAFIAIGIPIIKIWPFKFFLSCTSFLFFMKGWSISLIIACSQISKLWTCYLPPRPLFLCEGDTCVCSDCVNPTSKLMNGFLTMLEHQLKQYSLLKVATAACSSLSETNFLQFLAVKFCLVFSSLLFFSPSRQQSHLINMSKRRWNYLSIKIANPSSFIFSFKVYFHFQLPGWAYYCVWVCILYAGGCKS